MNKYWIMAALSMFVIAVCAVVVRTQVVQAAQQNTSAVRNNTEPLRAPLLNPTETALKLTQMPIRQLTEAAGRPMMNLTGAPHKPPLLTPAEDRRPLASPSGMMKRLADEKLRRCVAVSKNITMRSQNMVRTVAELQNKFMSIVEGVKAYYVKNGLKLSNYDELVVSIDTNNRLIEQHMTAAQEDVSQFSCNGENPSAQLKKLEVDIHLVLNALKEYRNTIRNLIVAIKGLTVSDVTGTATPSPTLVVTP
jgi:hypothetical protein